MNVSTSNQQATLPTPPSGESTASTPTTTNKTFATPTTTCALPSVVDALGGSSRSHPTKTSSDTSHDASTATRRHSTSTLFAANQHSTNNNAAMGHALILSPLTQAKLTTATNNLVRNLALMECCQDQSKLTTSPRGTKSFQLPVKDAGTIPPYKVQEFTRYFERMESAASSNGEEVNRELEQSVTQLKTQLAAKTAQVDDLQAQLSDKETLLEQAHNSVRELHRKLANDEHHLHHLEDTMVAHEQQHHAKVELLVQELNHALQVQQQQQQKPQQADEAVVSCSLLTTVQGLTRDLERREEQVEALETELDVAKSHYEAKIHALEHAVQAQQEQHALLNATALELVQLVHDTQQKHASPNNNHDGGISAMHALTSQHQRSVAKVARLEAACAQKDARIAHLEQQLYQQQSATNGCIIATATASIPSASCGDSLLDDLPVHEWIQECE